MKDQNKNNTENNQIIYKKYCLLQNIEKLFSLVDWFFPFPPVELTDVKILRTKN